ALPGAASTARSPWFQAVAVGAVILAAALAGWFAAELRRPGVFPVSGDFSITEPRNLESPNSPARDLSAMEPRAGEIREESAEDSIQAIPEAYAPRTAVLPEAQDDIGMLDLENDEKLLDLLDENPDLLAESLNAIEPGEVEIAEATVEKAGEQVAPAPAAQSEKTDDPGQDLSQAGFTAPDPRLPAAIQKVEAEALRGVAEAQHDLAAVYTAGHAGVSRDYTRAAFWFRKAADQGVANAAYNLGVLNHQGLGVPVDIKAAIGWYEKAAELGHPEAQYNLGIAYIEGVGVTYMPQKAARYFEAAAAEGVLEAAYNLGLIYENGLLGKPEPDKALMWYKRAADKGNPEAKAALSQLAKSLDMDVNEVNGIVESLKEGDRKAETPVAPVSVPDKTISRENARLSPVVAPGAPVRETREAGLQAPPPNQALLAQVQDYLMKSGLYPGPADGRGGPLTEDAIRSYQSLNGLSVDGRANEKLLAHMLTNPGDYLKN
ncbi:MAG: SEL1-like repeat protein, partial [Alphaproteobacteria bacterium]|nr:SEL1-like repeat protein [Alphaproteobacteria bacterium]